MNAAKKLRATGHLYANCQSWATCEFEVASIIDEETHADELRIALKAICNAYASNGNTRSQKDAFANGRAVLKKVGDE